MSTGDAVLELKAAAAADAAGRATSPAAPPADTVHAERRRRQRGIAILVGSSCLFAVMAVGVRVAAREMPAMQIAWVRFAGSFVLLAGLARGRRVRLRPRPGNLGRVLLRGVLGGAAIVCYFVAIERIGAGLATLVHCMYPLATAALAVAFLGEPPSGRLAAALGLEVLGLLLVAAPAGAVAVVPAGGLAIALTGALLAGGAVATASRLRDSEEASLITVYFMAVGACMTAPALVGGVPAVSPAAAAALSVVVVTSAAGQWLLHHGLGFTSATLGSLTCATGVFTAAALEALVLGEPMRPRAAAGAVLMIAAVGVAGTARRQART
jgi:drug/metabolite transporter (DMT)-like permease